MDPGWEWEGARRVETSVLCLLLLKCWGIENLGVVALWRLFFGKPFGGDFNQPTAKKEKKFGDPHNGENPSLVVVD